MDDLTPRLADLLWRYQVEFRRLSDAESEQTIESFRREMAVLIAEHGREAVIRTAPRCTPSRWPCTDAPPLGLVQNLAQGQESGGAGCDAVWAEGGL